MDVQMPVMDGYDAPYVYQRDGSPEGMIISILNDFSTETGVPLHYTFAESRSEADKMLDDGNTHDSSGALVRYIRQYPARAAAIISILTAFVACGAFMMFYAQRMNRKNKELPQSNALSF